MKDKNSVAENMRRATGAAPRPNPLNDPMQRPLAGNSNPIQRPPTVGKVPPPKRSTKVKKKNKSDK